jgi:hypothetical protein
LARIQALRPNPPSLWRRSQWFVPPRSRGAARAPARHLEGTRCSTSTTGDFPIRVTGWWISTPAAQGSKPKRINRAIGCSSRASRFTTPAPTGDRRQLRAGRKTADLGRLHQLRHGARALRCQGPLGLHEGAGEGWANQERPPHTGRHRQRAGERHRRSDCSYNARCSIKCWRLACTASCCATPTIPAPSKRSSKPSACQTTCRGGQGISEGRRGVHGADNAPIWGVPASGYFRGRLAAQSRRLAPDGPVLETAALANADVNTRSGIAFASGSW